MVDETNTTEIPHVGTYAGHTGHRPWRPLWWKGYRPRVRPLCGSPKVHDLSAIYLKTLDDTKYGAQSVVSQAPALGLVLMARRSLKSTGEWGEVSEHKSLRCINTINPSRSLRVAYASFGSHNFLSWPGAQLSILTSSVLCRCDSAC